MTDGTKGRDASFDFSLPDNRREFEKLFDSAIRKNRFAVSVVFPVVGAVMLVASAEGIMPEPLSFNPWLLLFGVVVMRSPLIAGVFPLFDKRALGFVGVLVAYTYAVEAVGIYTGLPYGEFEYGVSLGPTLGGIPLALPIFFIPLAMNAYLLCLLLLGNRARSLAVRLGVVIPTVVAIDVVLDPGAVALGFWSFAEGEFYGVPFSNYVGWMISATVAVVLLDSAFNRKSLTERLRSCEFMLDDLVSFVILWGTINLWFGNLVSVFVALVFGAGLVYADAFDARLFDPRKIGW